LVNGFSNCDSFGPAVVEAAIKAGVERATTMIVFYTTLFDPAEAKVNPKGSAEVYRGISLLLILMGSSNHRAAGNAGTTPCLYIRRPRPGAPQHERSPTSE
jgi:hypothetical protein